MKRLLCLLTGAVVVTTVLANDHAAASIDDPIRGQQIVSTICGACHNADGNSSVTNPKLAGQHPAALGGFPGQPLVDKFIGFH